MRTGAVVRLESLSGVYVCEFGVLPLRCINKSQSYTHVTPHSRVYQNIIT